eukprot:3213884-Pyramimonas_sp.AAC.1
MKDSRAKRSPPGLPPLPSTQLPYSSQPPCLGFPHTVWLAHILREVSGVCEWDPRSWLSGHYHYHSVWSPADAAALHAVK